MNKKTISKFIKIAIYIVAMIALIVYELKLNSSYQSFKKIYDDSNEAGALASLRIIRFGMIFYTEFIISIASALALAVFVFLDFKQNKQFNVIMLVAQILCSIAINLIIFFNITNLDFLLAGYILCGVWVVALIIHSAIVKRKNGVAIIS